MHESMVASLSEQERACLQGVAELKRSKQIGFELGLQPGTVDTYIARAVRKLGVSDRATAVRLLIDAGVLSGKSGSSFSDVEPAAAIGNPSRWARFPWPFPTSERPTNDLGSSGTGIAIVLATSLMLAAVAMFFLAVRMIAEWRG